jgi:hypothetical protein
MSNIPHAPWLTGCWCFDCNDAPELGLSNPTMFTMYLCPQCGNKRCPCASNHSNACTGSNDVGQPGSIYGGRGNESEDT